MLVHCPVARADARATDPPLVLSEPREARPPQGPHGVDGRPGAGEGEVLVLVLSEGGTVWSSVRHRSSPASKWIGRTRASSSTSAAAAGLA
eukprot:3983759-Alexandrium_andersonii.AAC.1